MSFLFSRMLKPRTLPSIPPQTKQLKKDERVRQGETQTIRQDRQIIYVKTRNNVRILIILQYRYHCHVHRPIEIWISRFRPHADETKTDLDRAANACAFHRFFKTTEW